MKKSSNLHKALTNKDDDSQEKTVYQTQDFQDADAEITGDDDRETGQDFVVQESSPKTSLNSIDGYKKLTSPFKVDSSNRKHIII